MINRSITWLIWLSLLLTLLHFVSSTKVSTQTKHNQRRSSHSTVKHVTSAVKSKQRHIKGLFSNRFSYFRKFRLFRNDSKLARNKMISSLRLASQRYCLELKAWRSSLFDRSCIKASRPDNHAPKEKHVQFIISMIQQAADNDDLTQVENPYVSMLSIIWLRANYVDHRTGIKAFYVLHRLCQSISCDHVESFQQCLSDMTSNMHCSATKSNYYDISRLGMDAVALSPYQTFLHNYSSYVIHRGLSFGPSFEEFLMNPVPSTDDAYPRHIEHLGKLLEKAYECLSLLLKCSVSVHDDKHGHDGIINHVTISGIDMLARDLEDLYPLFECKMNDYLSSLLDAQVNNARIISNMDVEMRRAGVMLQRMEQLRSDLLVWVSNHSQLLSKNNYRPITLYNGDLILAYSYVHEICPSAKKFPNVNEVADSELFAPDIASIP